MKSSRRSRSSTATFPLSPLVTAARRTGTPRRALPSRGRPSPPSRRCRARRRTFSTQTQPDRRADGDRSRASTTGTTASRPCSRSSTATAGGSRSRRPHPELAPEQRQTPASTCELCQRASDRMQDGIKFLDADEKATEAFRLANHAMLLQQQRSGHAAGHDRHDREGSASDEGPFTAHERAADHGGRSRSRSCSPPSGRRSRTKIREPRDRRADLLPDRRRQDRGLPRR